MKATCLENLVFALVLDSIAAGPEADEFVHLLCLPQADVPAGKADAPQGGASGTGSRPVAGMTTLPAARRRNHVVT